MKLLRKMGYKGGELGKNEQGTVDPIETIMRPKNMDVGFTDFKKAMPTKLQGLRPAKEDESGEQGAGVRMKESGLKHAKSKKKKKKVFIKAEEKLLAKEERDSFQVVQEVVDMRGPHVRVLTNLENLSLEEDVNAPVIEVQQNVRSSMKWAELEIQKNDRDMRNGEKTSMSLQKKERFEMQAARQNEGLNNMKLMTILGRIEEENAIGTLTLESLAESFSDLQRRFPGHYEHRNLSRIALSYCWPLFIQVFQGWDPLQNPFHGLELVTVWENLLRGDSDDDIFGVGTCYTKLIMKVVLPAVRRTCINTREAKDTEPMLRLLKGWKKLLPPSIFLDILDQIVMPKVSSAVNSWDPRRETFLINFAVLPWVPLLGLGT
ncbi:septin and tuftelin-interacting protein 1 1 [Tripterygium wilfordii]|uniref:Septin and tuftelin-interacting protein 1 1 n=1 Tax=Tripterygium wilfordii TaxID=458696 RepID=A0A7J7CXL9_TRIWF|nr:septin and tuftelin-interacting protein 1 1 [Tripterygium wilfordii]